MELFVIIISVASLTTNLFLVRWITGNKKQELLNYELLSHECRCWGTVAQQEPVTVQETREPEVQASENPVVPAIDESHQAWRNIKEQPQSVPSISPSQPAPKPGPMERPAGFYR